MLIFSWTTSLGLFGISLLCNTTWSLWLFFGVCVANLLTVKQTSGKTGRRLLLYDFLGFLMVLIVFKYWYAAGSLEPIESQDIIDYAFTNVFNSNRALLVSGLLFYLCWIIAIMFVYKTVWHEKDKHFLILTTCGILLYDLLVVILSPFFYTLKYNSFVWHRPLNYFIFIFIALSLPWLLETWRSRIWKGAIIFLVIFAFSFPYQVNVINFFGSKIENRDLTALYNFKDRKLVEYLTQQDMRLIRQYIPRNEVVYTDKTTAHSLPFWTDVYPLFIDHVSNVRVKNIDYQRRLRAWKTIRYTYDPNELKKALDFFNVRYFVLNNNSQHAFPRIFKMGAPYEIKAVGENIVIGTFFDESRG